LQGKSPFAEQIAILALADVAYAASDVSAVWRLAVGARAVSAAAIRARSVGQGLALAEVRLTVVVNTIHRLGICHHLGCLGIPSAVH
jgi:hypothetical protein